MCGRVKWFDSVKGYGFIVADDAESDILIHYNLLSDLGKKSLPEGATVTALVRKGPRGLQAVALEKVDLSTALPTVPRAPATDRVADTADAGDYELATVRWFNRTKGYGFLFCADGITQAFIHAETIRRQGYDTLEPEQRLLARITHGPRGALVVEIKPGH